MIAKLRSKSILLNNVTNVILQKTSILSKSFRFKFDISLFLCCALCMSVILGIVYYFLDLHKFESELLYKKNVVVLPTFEKLKEDLIKLQYQATYLVHDISRKNIKNNMSDLELIQNSNCLINKESTERKNFTIQEHAGGLKSLSVIYTAKNGEAIECIIDLYSLKKKISRIDHILTHISYYLQLDNGYDMQNEIIDIGGLLQNNKLYFIEKLPIFKNLSVVFGYSENLINARKMLSLKRAIIGAIILLSILTLFYCVFRRLLVFFLCRNAMTTKNKIIQEFELLKLDYNNLKLKLSLVKSELSFLNTLQEEIIAKLYQNCHVIENIAKHLSQPNTNKKETEWLIDQVAILSNQFLGKGIKIYNNNYINIKDLITNGLQLFSTQIHNKQINLINEVPEETIFCDIDVIALKQILLSLINLVITRLMKKDTLIISFEITPHHYLFTIKDNSLNDTISDQVDITQKKGANILLDQEELHALLKFYNTEYTKLKEKNYNVITTTFKKPKVESENNVKTHLETKSTNIIKMRDYVKNDR